MWRPAGLVVASALCGCAAKPPPKEPFAVAGPANIVRSAPNVPDFASRPYAPFSRAAVVGIALREWRLFGQMVDDDPPGTRPPPLPDQKPERFEGLWQRVGEYWYESQDLGEPEASWTGKHDAFGVEFPASEDSDYAWSAAFVSYVMRIAGATQRFPYARSHHVYINAARRAADGQEAGWAISAEPIDGYAPVPGDVICTSRTRRPIRYADLPTAHSFPAHCDVVVAVTPGSLTVVGGNVDDAVTAKHVPVTVDGKLGVAADGPLDTRYPWFVVLRVIYDAVVAGS